MTYRESDAMIVKCPQCRNHVELPENADVTEMRCTACKVIFRVDGMASETGIQDNLPEVASPPSAIKVRTGVTVRSTANDMLDDDKRFKSDIQQDRKAVEEIAKSKTRRVGLIVLGVILFTLATVLVNGMVGTINEMMLTARAGRAVSARVLAQPLVGMSFFVPSTVLVALGCVCLFRLGSRGLIVTGIVMNFVLMLMFGGMIALDIYILKVAGDEDAFGAPPSLVVVMLLMHCIAILLNLAAAILSMMTLIDSDVAAAYLIRTKHVERRRLS